MDNLESQFAQLEAGSGVDDELAALKAKMMGGSSPSQSALPPSDAARTPVSGAAIDAELEALRRQMG
jgi:phage shock protein A